MFRLPRLRFIVLLALGAVSLIALVAAVHAQQPETARPTTLSDDVIRIDTNLVQTEVMVFDRQGRFVAGLRPDQFELNLNGTRQPVSFFEQVTSGSAAESLQLAAARGASGKSADSKIASARAPDSGRMIFFFVDDLHLSTASLARAKKTLQAFVDDQMNSNDQVAIVSASGQIGFLQQLTDNPTVLKTAISRLNYKQSTEVNTGKTQISDYMASQVLDYGNRELYAYLLESVKVEQQMGPGSRHGDHGLAASYSAAPYLRNRLRQINEQSRMTTADTLLVLESLMESSTALPGRKLVFFLSDGFVINERKSGALETLERLTRAATRSGVVVYTIDVRGIFSNLGSSTDASTNAYVDLSGRRAGVAMGEVTATQEALKLIADGTGGRAILNDNGIGQAILAGIQETADYYLLAWKPDSSYSNDKSKLEVEVRIKDRPDLSVRLRNNLFGGSNASVESSSMLGTTTIKGTTKKAKSDPTQTPLLKTLGALYADKRLPVLLSVGYLKSGERDFTMKVSMQLDRRKLNFDTDAKSLVDVVGVALDDRGQFASFKQLLSLPADMRGTSQTFDWSQQLSLPPGLYQVRVALQERNTGRTGSAMQWIELPDPRGNPFVLSSLFLGERKVEDSATAQSGPQQITVDVDNRFARSSALRFQTYIYNASRSGTGPKVTIQAKLFRNREAVMTTALSTVPVTSDGPRLPYWSEIGLAGLVPGRYVLQVTATDLVGSRSAIQRVTFTVE